MRIVLSLAALVLPGARSPGQSAIDYNDYYRFPISLGFEYRSLSPFGQYGAQFNLFDLSLDARVPVPSAPILQPVVRLGMMSFDSQDLANPVEWDHAHWYGMAGLTAAHRFAKTFEIGGEILAGASVALFPHLLPQAGTVSTVNIVADAGARIGLDPAFNFSIEVHPGVRYLKSLGPLTDFDGFIFGIGFSATYRFGSDPDAPTAVIRAIRFEPPEMSTLFAAMQSYYARNPAGKARITNTEKAALTEVKVSFFQAGYMDSPTPCPAPSELAPGESREVPLLALFNDSVFRTAGVTPLTGEIVVSYKLRGRPAEQRQAVSYDLQDRSAITWDDDRKVAAFITPADGALRNYTSYIRQACKEQVLPGLEESLQTAIQAYRALGVIGVLYQTDPTVPFTVAKGNAQVVDSVSLPRETLTRITGDCDDLTVLYCSLLESAGIETGFVTVPGHIYSVFNTRVPTAEFSRLHPDRGMTIGVNGEAWVPVEITMIGKAGFLEAWRSAAMEWNSLQGTPERRALYRTRAAQEVYRPVGLKEVDLGLQYGGRGEVARAFREELDRLGEVAAAPLAEAARKNGRKQEYNRLGIVYAQYARYPQAEQAFRDALRADPAYVSARANLGSLQLLRDDARSALDTLLPVLSELEKHPGELTATTVKVLLNVAQASYRIGRYEDAQGYYARAQSVDPAGSERYAWLAQSATGDGQTRAAAQGTVRALFMGGEE